MWWNKKREEEEKEEHEHKFCSECGVLLRWGQKVVNDGWDQYYCEQHKRPYDRVERTGGYQYRDEYDSLKWKPVQHHYYKEFEVDEKGKLV